MELTPLPLIGLRSDRADDVYDISDAFCGVGEPCDAVNW